MKPLSRAALACLAAVLTLLTDVAPSRACPACNIHNYLSHSVDDAKNIYVGEVVSATKEGSVVSVVEVIRGTVKIGDRRDEEFRGYEAGEKLVVLTGLEAPPGPTFPHLPLLFKDEIRFLAGKDPKITDAADAIVKLQWVSRKSNDLAKTYIKEHYPECRDALIAAYRALYARRDKWSEEVLLSHRLNNLVTMLASTDDARSREFLLSVIDDLAKLPGGEIKWDDRPFRGDPEGTILKALVSENETNAEARRVLRAHLERRARELKGSNLRWFAYALGDADLAACGTLLKSLDAEARRAAAVGVFDLSRYYQSWWANKECEQATALALTLSDDPELKKLANEQNERLEFFRPKPKQDQPRKEAKP